jgi:hypothetical protein
LHPTTDLRGRHSARLTVALQLPLFLLLLRNLIEFRPPLLANA